MNATIFTLTVCASLGVYLMAAPRAKADADDDQSSDQENITNVVSVQTGTVQRMTLRRTIGAFATIAPAPARGHEPAADASLSAASAGVVAAVNIAEGQEVKQGQLLMTLNSSSATAKSARQELARQKKLYAEHNTSLKALQDAETQMALLEVAAPLAGTVVHLNVKPGSAVDATTVVAEITDLSRLVAKADVPEADAQELRTGQPVELQAQPPVHGTVVYISPTVNTASDTIQACVALPPDAGLRPGQFVPLQIVTAIHTNCLAAPKESVITDDDGHSHIDVVQGNQAMQTPVNTGFRENNWVEVAGTGLTAGATVVTVGAYGLPDKTQVEVVNPTADNSAATNSASPTAP